MAVMVLPGWSSVRGGGEDQGASGSETQVRAASAGRGSHAPVTPQQKFTRDQTGLEKDAPDFRCNKKAAGKTAVWGPIKDAKIKEPQLNSCSFDLKTEADFWCPQRRVSSRCSS